jgi:diguanylate cyclase (GGDEF)-like protein
MPPKTPTDSASPLAWRGWAVWSRGRPYAAYILAIDAVAITLLLVAIVQSELRLVFFARVFILLGLFLFFEEATRRTEKTRFQLSDRNANVDMTSPWTMAAVVTLSSAYAFAVIIGIFLYTWFRRLRHTHSHPYNWIFSAANVMLSCAAGERALSTVGPHITSLPNSVLTAMTILVGLTMYTIVNRCLVFGAVYFQTRGKEKINIVGTWHDNSFEVATLCLGILNAVALLYQPWLIVVTLPLMFTLQRGAMVTELEEAASTDAKTGLLNAVAWHRVAQRELARSERLDVPGAVLLIDLDHFKVVNDTHGHLMGDVVLSAVARTLVSELREYDAVGRFGGEEFVAVLPDVDVPTAMAISDRIRRHIAGLRLADLEGAGRITSVGPNDSLTASIGVAHYPAHGTDLESLLHAADTALYVAKRSGRNKVVLADRGAGEDSDKKAPVDALR